MKDEKPEGLNHFSDPKYEGLFIIYLFKCLQNTQSGKEIFISPFH